MINALQAQHIPLTGKHLIEASAGTGKTFNITRIYLRLLLERKLTVEQILVMTFTKDATEEIKGRIDAFIRQAINQWNELVLSDEYFVELSKKISAEEAIFLLKRALLFLDDAAIFTIHGFCKRVLNQHAFATGVSFDAKMETDCQDIVIEACQDWYRKHAINFPEQYLLLAQFWPSPTRFLADFSKAIARESSIEYLSIDDLISQFQQLSASALNDLEQNVSELIDYLIHPKNAAEQTKRLEELSFLKSWLNAISENVEHAFTTMPTAFMDGRRYSRSPNKARILEIFSQANEVKVKSVKLSVTLNKAKANALVKSAVLDIRKDIKTKKRQQAVLSFDDLIATLAEKLSPTEQLNSQQNESLANILYNQYPVALVDEFQDTDPLQFNILKAIYYRQAKAGLFMIGDPKQAIYGFRGGDVFAYLDAREQCDYKWVMDTNWRSSKEMIQGYNRLFYGNALHEEAQDVFGYNIPYQAVKASPIAQTLSFNSLRQADKSILKEDNNKEENTKAENIKASSTDEAEQKALQFVYFTPPDDSNKVKQSFRTVMAQWCAQEILNLLSVSHNSEDDLIENKVQTKTLNAQDIAILVRDGAEAKSVKEALSDIGLSSVFLSNRANLFHSKQAKQLLLILKSILYVENERQFSAGLTSTLLNFPPVELYQLQQDDLAWQNLKTSFVDLRDDWQTKGFISMAFKLMHEHFNVMQGHGIDNKNRVLTNLLHLFELLQTASQRYHQPQELLFWFELQIQSDNPQSEAELRLESEEQLIRIVTQHGSKGLEYPVVFIPFASRFKNPLKFGNKNVNLIEYHNEQKQLVLSIDDTEQAKSAMANEAYAEAIRLLYVAVTRAEQRCYILTTPFENYHNSPLGRTLKWQAEEDCLSSLNNLAQDCPESIGVIEVNTLEEMAKYIPDKKGNKQTLIPTFTSKIERDWWLSSFSALSRNLRNIGVSIPDRDSQLLSLSVLSENKESESALLRFNLAKGAHTGNFLHDILEQVNFIKPDWQHHLTQQLARYAQSDIDLQTLQAWLEDVLAAPLDKGGSLSTLSKDKTLRESEFYFPMNLNNSEQLTAILTKHRQQHRIEDNHSINSGFNERIHLPSYKKLKGMMHGFIDLIFEHQGKYYVCDYKSSHLGNEFSCYSQAAMQENIESHFYDLQYLIYSLALHRQLKFSLADYQPSQHFGGVYYLYLRGMTSQPEHHKSGVFYRSIKSEELLRLDNLFAGEEVFVDE